MADVTNVASGNQVVNLRPAASSEAVTREEQATFSEVEESTQSNTEANQENETSGGSDDETPNSPFDRAADALQNLLPENEFPPNTRLRINLDDDSGRFVYQSVDNDSGEVVRQFPSEAILELVNSFRPITGLAVDDTA